jgi:hypothetical protein
LEKKIWKTRLSRKLNAARPDHNRKDEPLYNLPFQMLRSSRLQIFKFSNLKVLTIFTMSAMLTMLKTNHPDLSIANFRLSRQYFSGHWHILIMIWNVGNKGLRASDTISKIYLMAESHNQIVEFERHFVSLHSFKLRDSDKDKFKSNFITEYLCWNVNLQIAKTLIIEWGDAHLRMSFRCKHLSR